jgi:Flp pilus assembly protein TadD
MTFAVRFVVHQPLSVSNCLFFLLGFLVVANCGLVAQPTGSPGVAPASDVGIACILHDGRGTPVSGVSVEIRSVAGPLMRVFGPTLPDGSIAAHGLAAGAYDIRVANGLLFPAKRVQVSNSFSTVVITLPIILPQVEGAIHDTVSVEQLSVPEKVLDTLRRAYQAWDRSDLVQSRNLAVRALQLSPHYEPALTLVGMLDLAEHHPSDAVIELEQAVRDNPNAPRVYLALASAYNELHRNNDALDALSIMAKLLPDSWQLHYQLGCARLGQGEYQISLTEFDRAQRLAPEDLIVLHVGKAHALLGLRDYPAARVELETVLRKAPDGPYAAESRRFATALDSRLKNGPPVANATTQATEPQ